MFATIVLSVLLAAAVLGILYSLWKKKKKGGCCGGCSGCSGSCVCQKTHEAKK
ncbi:FeoB-associated Cys-rich membrane protein [Ructibacterium gallinarum]|uniref:FeoB-associated Cys-rich membrane protein n=1 Tax=Ructibacterium gallinarum TaxID=2779355 RepID=A0A9D5RBC3_9FIRM|nr:FeoB-associated Cys-rich membrane protein [Ructibacterium gallinarum]MBE5039883.1 FeoB-associated Cys-rich membrane protein [Ructibacterium gallinarum]